MIAGHTLIVVAEDDSALAGRRPTRLTEPGPRPARHRRRRDDHPTQALLIGWNERAPIVLRELDHYAPPGSTLTVLTSFGEPVVPRPAEPRGHRRARPDHRPRARSRSTSRPDLDQVIVLCYSDDLEPQTADARTLVTLLHVRDILSRLGVRDAGGQRDARRPQPGARPGRRRRRRRRQRRDRQPAGHPALRGPPARGGLRRSCSATRAARSTCGRPSGTSSPAPRSPTPRSSPGRPAATRPRSATSPRRWPSGEACVRRAREPGEVADLPGAARATGWSCSPRTDLVNGRMGGRQRALAGAARRDRVERGRAAHVDDRPAAAADGEEVARALAPRLAEVDFALVLTSPRLRARRTAELAGFARAEVDDDLVEWGYGDYEGVTTDEIRETVPGWTVWTAPDARAARPPPIGRRAPGPGGRPGRAAVDGPTARLRPRPRAARPGRPLARPRRRRGPAPRASTPRPSPSSAGSASPRSSCAGTRDPERRERRVGGVGDPDAGSAGLVERGDGWRR